MKYLVYKVDNEAIRNNKVVKGVFLKAQRCDTLNWDYLGEFVSLEDAIAFVKGISYGSIVYDFAGYEINLKNNNHRPECPDNRKESTMKTEATLYRATLENLIKMYEYELNNVEDEKFKEFYRGMIVAYKGLLVLFKEDYNEL